MEFKNTLIGMFSSETLTKENQITGNHEMKVFVYGNDGPVPHIHVLGTQNDDICVRLDVAEYYAHKGHYGRFTKYEYDAFCNFINEYWGFAKNVWNTNAEEFNNESTKGKRMVIKATAMPEYIKLKAEKIIRE